VCIERTSFPYGMLTRWMYQRRLEMIGSVGTILLLDYRVLHTLMITYPPSVLVNLKIVLQTCPLPALPLSIRQWLNTKNDKKLHYFVECDKGWLLVKDVK
jgi:hypothetical protein